MPQGLGRIVTSLGTLDPPYSSMQYSVAGSLKIVEGGTPPEMLSQTDGVVRYKRYEQYGAAIANLTGAKSKSIYAETYSSLLASSIESAEHLGTTMGNVSLEEPWDTTGLEGKKEIGFVNQLKQVAKVIRSRSVLQHDRDVFVVELGGFDSHFVITDNTFENWKALDTGMKHFVNEVRWRMGP